MMRGGAGLVCAAAALRAAAVSLVGVLIAIDLASRGQSAAEIGLVLGVGIAGGAVGTILAGLYADRWGRARTLIAIGAISGTGYVAIALVDGLVALSLLAFFCMVNGLGRDRGPASALEQALLPAMTAAERRTWALAWYNAGVDTGHAVGALGAAIPTLLVAAAGLGERGAHAVTFAACGLLVIGSSSVYALVGAAAEAPRAGEEPLRPSQIDPVARRRVHTIAALFAMDSTGGGFLSSALVAYWFFEQYGTTELQLALLFFAARVLNVVSHLAAAWLARRIGLLNTMVFTHLPSSVFLMLAPFAPTATTAALLFLLREALVEMDVPTRQSYVMAVVPDAARTYASAVTNVTRTAGWAVGPLAGGAVMQHVAFSAPLVIGGTLKIAYDLMLYRSFRHIRPPEEAAPAPAA